MFAVHTGNRGLAVCQAHIDPHSHDGERIPFRLDKALPDHQWAVFVDGRRVGHLHDITEHVIHDVRRALAKVAPEEKPAPPLEEFTPAPRAMMPVQSPAARVPTEPETPVYPVDHAGQCRLAV